eukprot:1862840-Pyramimonas_sp.AAC.1
MDAPPNETPRSMDAASNKTQASKEDFTITIDMCTNETLPSIVELCGNEPQTPEEENAGSRRASGGRGPRGREGRGQERSRSNEQDN